MGGDDFNQVLGSGFRVYQRQQEVTEVDAADAQKQQRRVKTEPRDDPVAASSDGAPQAQPEARHAEPNQQLDRWQQPGTGQPVPQETSELRQDTSELQHREEAVDQPLVFNSVQREHLVLQREEVHRQHEAALLAKHRQAVQREQALLAREHKLEAAWQQKQQVQRD